MKKIHTSSVLLFGITGGIGFQIYEVLRQRPVRIAGYYFKNNRRAAQIASDGKVPVKSVDLSMQGSLGKLSLPNYQTIIYAVGKPFFCENLLDFSINTASEQMNLNVISLLNIIRLAITRRNSGLKKLIIVTSRCDGRMKSIYHLSKILQTTMLERMLPELRRRGISVSLISVGWVDTNMFRRYTEYTRQLRRTKQPNIRPLNPKSVAMACVNEMNNITPFREICLG